jgi:RsiW-degrading membrane proteinase PrsW (M82 family)
MAYTKLVMANPYTGEIKEAPVGFSWTVLFFGFIPPLFRRDWKWAIIMFLLTMITMGLSGLLFMFIYNKLYIRDLIGDEYIVKSVGTGTIEQVSQDLGINLPVR